MLSHYVGDILFITFHRTFSNVKVTHNRKWRLFIKNTGQC